MKYARFTLFFRPGFSVVWAVEIPYESDIDLAMRIYAKLREYQPGEVVRYLVEFPPPETPAATPSP